MKHAKYVVWRVIGLTALVYLFAFLIYNAEAEMYSSAMLGTFNSAKASRVETKFLNLGYREPLGHGFSWQGEAGGWTDSAGNGRTGSGYGAFQGNFIAGDSVFARLSAGPSLVTAPDSYLSGHFQFTEDLFLGLQGSNKNVVGVKYKHFSNAGLRQPNLGRDFMGIEASVSF